MNAAIKTGKIKNGKHKKLKLGKESTVL